MYLLQQKQWKDECGSDCFKNFKMMITNIEFLFTLYINFLYEIDLQVEF